MICMWGGGCCCGLEVVCSGMHLCHVPGRVLIQSVWPSGLVNGVGVGSE